VSVDDDAVAEFFKRWYRTMVRMGLALGAGQLDAEDAASAVALQVIRSWSHWTAAKKQYSYLHKAMRNELRKTMRKQSTRQEVQSRWAHDVRWFEPGDSTADAYARARESDGVRQCLAITTQRQRQILAWLCLRQQAGWRVADIADALGITRATIRAQRRFARNTLEPLLLGDEREHRQWLRAGERIHADFHRGRTGPFAPRPIIRRAWTLLREFGVPPEHSTQITVLGRSELQERRQQSPIPASSPVLAELADLATRNGLLAVVLDAQGTVLRRRGDNDALAAADQLGFVDGACWDLHHAGVNAAGLAQILGAPATVNRWEHSSPDQHGLCCVAIPVRIPHHRHITINVTATADVLTSVPRAIHPQLHTIARRLHQQMRTSGSHADRN
jgi:RNA polymerase sigma factor (sigma-70 family)